MADRSFGDPANDASLAAATLNASRSSSRARNRRPAQNHVEDIEERQYWTRTGVSSARAGSRTSYSYGHTDSLTDHGGMHGSVGSGRPFASRSPSLIHGAGMDGPNSLETSIKQGWASFRDLASTFIGLGDEVYQGTSSLGSNQRQAADTAGRREGDARVGHAHSALATGSRIHTSRSVHQLGNFKRRTSDASLENGAKDLDATQMDQMVYIHHVLAGDTYAGLTLRYRCHKDGIGKANGLWSRDNIQVRKWLAIPCDSCEIRGTPCEPNAAPSQPQSVIFDKGPHDADIATSKEAGVHGINTITHSSSAAIAAAASVDDFPWKHVRWVWVESFPHPIEVVRMSRRTLGYFPPRRKRGGSGGGSGTLPPSPNLTPRQSIETTGSPPGSTRSRFPLSDAPPQRPSPTPASALPDNDHHHPGQRPAWMRRPGGVGTLSRNVTVPGPERDYLNSWTKKHLPGLNLDSYPSMSIAETPARDDFDLSLRDADLSRPPREHTGTTDSPSQTSGLDRAAAAVETWMRGAITSLRTGTPTRDFTMGPLGEGDLIELEDTNSDDGNLRIDPVTPMSALSQKRSSSSIGFTTTKAMTTNKIIRQPNRKED